MDEFDKTELTSLEEKYRKKVQAKISNCLYCQPYDGGEAVWIWGDRIGLDELFMDMGVPEKHWENIAEHLGCPYCGNDTFDLTLDVGTKTKYDIEIENHIETAKKKYGIKISALEKLLEASPLLALSSPFAKDIYKELKERKLPIINIQGDFYRARRSTDESVLNIDKMLNPPVGKPTEGRFNHSGQSHLYLANSKETAIKEVISDNQQVLVWTQKFSIKKNIENILDLSFDWLNLSPSTSALLLSLKISDSLEKHKNNIDHWKPDYLLTRFIMDCAKSLGYNGIRYNSTKDSMDYDLVLFFPEKFEISPNDEPKIEVYVKKESNRDFDLLDY